MPGRKKMRPDSSYSVSVQNIIWLLAVVPSVLGSKYTNVTTVLENIPNNNASENNPFQTFSGREDFPCQNQQNKEIVTLEQNLKELSVQAEQLKSEIETTNQSIIISKNFTDTRSLTNENNELRKWNEEKTKLISRFRATYFTNKYEDTELHFAVNQNDEEAVKKLIHLGININARNNLQETPLHRAAVAVGANKSVEFKIIKHLIEEGADVFAKDYYNRTFLHNLASTKASLTPSQFHNMTNYLILKNLTSLFNIADISYKTSLMIAVGTMEVELGTLTLLHNNGIDFNHPGPVLHWAIWGNRDAQFVSSLIALGADVNYTAAWNGESLLHIAAYTGNLDVMKLLLRLGFDINGTDIKGFTPLHRVVFLKRANILKTVQFLVENGANVQIKDTYGRTAYDYVASTSHTSSSVHDEYMMRKLLKPN